MPTNYTANYHLNQWERSDKVLMEDFNTDNAKIDAAIKAEAGARAEGDAALSAALSKLGNCQVYLASATNTDTSGSLPTARISLPGRPLALLGFNSLSYLVSAVPGANTAAYITPGSGLSFSANWNSAGTVVTFQGGEGSRHVLGCKLILAFYAKS